jgi:hypothetical protein
MPKKGFKHSEESIKKMSESHKKRFEEDPNARIINSEAQKRYYAETPGAIEKNIEAQKRVYINDPHARDRSRERQKRSHDKPEVKERMSIAQKKYFSEHPEAKVAQSVRRTGTKASKATTIRMSETRRGENNPHYKHGLTDVYHNTRYSAKNNEFRGAVFQRDNFIDQITLQPLKHDERIVHHRVAYNDILQRHKIKTFDKAMECNALWNIDNGVTMSKQNHEQFHKIYGNHCPTISESKRREKQFARRLDRMLW